MKLLLLFSGLVLSVSLAAQYPSNGIKSRLGWQTTGDGLIYRGSGAPAYSPGTMFNAWMYLDTVSMALYSYKNFQWVRVPNANNGLSFSGQYVQLGGILVKNTAIKGYGYNFSVTDTITGGILGYKYGAPILGDTTAYFYRAFSDITGYNEAFIGQGRGINYIFNRDTTQEDNLFWQSTPTDLTIKAERGAIGTDTSFTIIEMSKDAFVVSNTGTNDDNNSSIALQNGGASLNAGYNGLDVKVQAISTPSDTGEIVIKTDRVARGLADIGQVLTLQDTIRGLVEFSTIDLSPYLEISDTAAMLAPYIERGDTATMLAPFIDGFGTTNRVPIFTGSRTIGNSNIQDNNTVVSILNSKPFSLGQWTTAGRPTGVQGYLGYNTTLNGIDWYNGTRWASALESTSPTFPANRLIHTDANGQATSDAGLTYTPSGGLNLVNSTSIVQDYGIDINSAVTTNGIGNVGGLIVRPTLTYGTGSSPAAYGIHVNPTFGSGFGGYAGIYLPAKTQYTGYARAAIVIQASSSNGIFIEGTSNNALIQTIPSNSTTVGFYNLSAADNNYGTSVTARVSSTVGVGVGMRFSVAPSGVSDANVNYSIGSVLSTLGSPTTQSKNDLVFRHTTSSAATERMRLTGDGLLGVGTATPLRRLHVAGDGYFDDSLRLATTPAHSAITGLLTRDANGWVGAASLAGGLSYSGGVLSASGVNTVYTASDSIRGDRYLEMANDGSATTALGYFPSFPDLSYTGETGLYLSPGYWGESMLVNGSSSLYNSISVSSTNALITSQGQIGLLGTSTFIAQSGEASMYSIGGSGISGKYTRISLDSLRFKAIKNISGTNYTYDFLPSLEVPPTTSTAKTVLQWTGDGIKANPAFVEVKRDTTIYVTDADYNFGTAITNAQVLARYNRIIIYSKLTVSATSDNQIILPSAASDFLQCTISVYSNDASGDADVTSIDFTTNGAVDGAGGTVSSYSMSGGQKVEIRAIDDGGYKWIFN